MEQQKKIEVDPNLQIEIGKLSAFEIGLIQQGLSNLPFGQVSGLINKLNGKIQEHFKAAEKIVKPKNKK